MPAGMPGEDVVLATAISTGIATMAMGLVANYPVSSLKLPICCKDPATKS